jgi:hypothetical protein
VVRRFALVGSLLAMLLGGCSGSSSIGDAELPALTGLEQSDLTGYWKLETIEVDGVVTPVEIGVNTARPAWILIGDGIEGSGGCNGFNSLDREPWTLRNGTLYPGDVMFTAALCVVEGESDAVMATETVVKLFLWGARENGFGVAITSDGTMRWSLGTTGLLFVPVDGPVHGPPPPPETGIGRLECSPGVMIRDRVSDTGVDGEVILRSAVPEVVVVNEDPVGWFWWGYDSSGTVIAAVAKGDIVPVVYELFTCEEH